MHRVDIAAESLRTLFVEMYWEHQLLSCGTAFYYICDRQPFLVTAWHNVSGRHAVSGAFLSDHSVDPTTVTVHDRVKGAHIGKLGKRDIRVVSDDQKPLWLEHPSLSLDVVALPVALDPVFLCDSWTADHPAVARNRLWVTDDVSVVGYPYGLKGGVDLPLWVRGTIASEPHIPYQDRPVFLVDSRTRKGQSGSPVLLFYRPNTQIPVHGDSRFRTSESPVSRLIGVYSGRISAESDLGYVWTVEALDEICRDGAPGSYNPPLKNLAGIHKPE
ncbi:hypothetical protein [Nocardia sp. NPDC005366]|uniref:hypothetical protein n=1 Tax=Nocardia sp. NPDC005366 TaxID=3156878 RepID=UPI0033B09FB8